MPLRHHDLWWSTNLNENIQVLNNIVGPNAFGADEIGKVGIFMQADNNSIVRGNTVQFVGGDFANTSSGADRYGIAIGNETWSIFQHDHIHELHR
ncbi:MAG: hypothetical protein R2818_05925 [Flavobacteriales bacterium]